MYIIYNNKSLNYVGTYFSKLKSNSFQKVKIN